jgi:hypothetical protein
VSNEDFLGGPPRLFERAGREQLIVLLEHGLTFSSRVLDVGCGVLRGGRWIIPLLDAEHYCGIEPQEHLVERGLREFVDPAVIELKRPRFDHNDRFDFSPFGVRFTHFMARSVWTHASKPQVESMLDGMAEWGAPGSVLLASWLPASVLRGRKDYRGTEWVGRSHRSSTAGMIAHRFGWIREAASKRGLAASRLDRAPLTRNGQVWALIRNPG